MCAFNGNLGACSDSPSKKYVPIRWLLHISTYPLCAVPHIRTNAAYQLRRESVCFWLQVLSQLRVVARTEGSAERFDREVWSTELSPLLNLWKKLNQVTHTHTNCCLTSIIHPYTVSLFYLSQGSELITKKVSPPVHSSPQPSPQRILTPLN